MYIPFVNIVEILVVGLRLISIRKIFLSVVQNGDPALQRQAQKMNNSIYWTGFDMENKKFKKGMKKHEMKRVS